MSAGAEGPRGTRARAARLGAGTAVPVAPRPPVASPATAPVPSPSTGDRELGPDELAALEEERAFLLTSLRDLEAEHDVGDVDDGDYEALKDDYTARAAAVIRAIEGHHAVRAAARPPASWGRRLAWIAAVLVLAIGAGLFVARSAGQRNAGDTLSGGSRQSTRDQLLTARQLQDQGDYTGAVKAYDQVLETDPTNVEALSYRGWMLRLVALSAEGEDRQLLQTKALEYLQRALQADPTDGTSLTFLAVLYGDLGQPQAALDTLAQVPAGEVPAFMSGTLDGFRSRMEREVAGASSSGGATTSTTTASTSSVGG